MKKHIAIYLAGTIKKGHESSDETYWSEKEISSITEYLKEYTVSFLNPASRSDNLSDQLSVFGRDMLQVASADIILVDARGKRGLGVGAEMMWAKSHHLPIVTWSPKDTHYYKSATTCLGVSVSDWIHPFVFSLSDVIIETLQDGANWITEYIEDRIPKIKSFTDIYDAVKYYMDTQLEHDAPMQQVLNTDARFTQKMHDLLYVDRLN